jgi:hypothetical protein
MAYIYHQGRTEKRGKVRQTIWLWHYDALGRSNRHTEEPLTVRHNSLQRLARRDQQAPLLHIHVLAVAPSQGVSSALVWHHG